MAKIAPLSMLRSEAIGLVLRQEHDHDPSDTSAERPQHIKPLVGTAALAMQAWLKASGIKEGAVFRRIRKGGHSAG
ncbi:MAG: hypothetical protein EOP82_22175 [Variovorax sp.]|nr:MAG: hypothetical protein EOP82_22175 [Variovorax sp.]